MAWILPFVLLGSCDKELVEYEKGSVEIVVERGDAWLHDFPAKTYGLAGVFKKGHNATLFLFTVHNAMLFTQFLACILCRAEGSGLDAV